MHKHTDQSLARWAHNEVTRRLTTRSSVDNRAPTLSKLDRVSFAPDKQIIFHLR